MMSIICIANFLNLLEQKDIFNHQRKFESEPVTNKIKEFALLTSQNLIFLRNFSGTILLQKFRQTNGFNIYDEFYSKLI